MIIENERRISNRTAANYYTLGKLPPQAIDLEEVVLGGIMLEKNALNKIIDILQVESFYKDNHQKIFKAIMSLYKNSKPIDILTVTAELRKAGELEMIGGAFYITELTSRIASAANIETHARIIYEKFLSREIIRISTEAIANGYDETCDIFELIENTQSFIFNLCSKQQGRQIKPIDKLVSERILEYHLPNENGLTGLGSGFASLDRITAGFQKTDLIIIAARPAMGKTALALQLAKNAAILFNTPVAIFSLEMSEKQLTDRLISSETGIYQDKLLRRELTEFDFQHLTTNTANLVKSKIFIDDTPGLHITSLRSKTTMLKKQHNIGLVVVDYLQLMEGFKEKGNSREQIIGNVSRTLKLIAKELEVPIIALSQLSRAVESRAGMAKRPMLSDLRESGSIEQDADSVIFLYRPDYYGITTDENNHSLIGLTECIFAKNRNGACETALLRFNPPLMKFSDWEIQSQF